MSVVGILQGDPAGIGPELLAKLLMRQVETSVLVIGDPAVFRRGEAVVGAKIPRREIERLTDIDFHADPIHHLNIRVEGAAELALGSASEIGGKTSLENMKTGFQLVRDGVLNGLVFMPFCKESMHLAGNPYADELGYARHFFAVTTRVSEFNVAHDMWNGRVTSHVALRDVFDSITFETVFESVKLADATLRAYGIARPRIALAALNPHAGEGGLLGREEIDILRPVVEYAQERQIGVHGPFPADTVWLKVRDGLYDCVMTMYHDQGQIAIKLMGFDRGVSILAGLPFPFATPAHGTGFDIAGKNQAFIEPSINAFDMVAQAVTARS